MSAQANTQQADNLIQLNEEKEKLRMGVIKYAQIARELEDKTKSQQERINELENKVQSLQNEQASLSAQQPNSKSDIQTKRIDEEEYKEISSIYFTSVQLYESLRNMKHEIDELTEKFERQYSLIKNFYINRYICSEDMK